MNKEFLEKALKDIILMTSNVDDNGMVWGMDTEINSLENLVNQAAEILKLYNRHYEESRKRLKKRILRELLI